MPKRGRRIRLRVPMVEIERNIDSLSAAGFEWSRACNRFVRNEDGKIVPPVLLTAYDHSAFRALLVEKFLIELPKIPLPDRGRD